MKEFKKATIYDEDIETTTSDITSFATEEFPWEANSDDDFICKIEEYTLRVEQMDKGHWWWRVYYKDDAIHERTNEFSNSKYRAIGYCEGLYMGHSLLNGG